MSELKCWKVSLEKGARKYVHYTEAIRPGKALQRALNYFEEVGIIKNTDLKMRKAISITITRVPQREAMEEDNAP